MPDAPAPDGGSLAGNLLTAATVPDHQGRTNWREALSRTFGTVAILTVLADERLGRISAGNSSGDVAMLLRIRAYVGRHLADPEPTPRIACAHDISVRSLREVVEGEYITVSRWIQRRRMEACLRDLGQGDNTALTVDAVAPRWGFTNAAHFSRAFRSAYGMAPSEWRDVRGSASHARVLVRSANPAKSAAASSFSDNTSYVLRQGAPHGKF
ncbi:AraC family transcriptional regulator [Streptomyces chartreusis]|uniref:AraC family transcriptional regulator n=1 Tax=Streptomyces chartreusis TaxID=1969 RepID=UPI0033AAF7F1